MQCPRIYSIVMCYIKFNRVVTKMMSWFSETGCEVRGYRKKERGEVEGRNRRVELPIRLLTDSPFLLYLSRLG